MPVPVPRHRLNYDEWKEERTQQTVERRRERKRQEAELQRQLEEERHQRVAKMREVRERWKDDRRSRDIHLAATLDMFERYKQKTEEKEEMLHLQEIEKTQHFRQRRKEIHEASVASREVFLRQSKQLQPLLEDVENSSIARFLHQERAALCQKALPRNVVGHSRGVQASLPVEPESSKSATY